MKTCPTCKSTTHHKITIWYETIDGKLVKFERCENCPTEERETGPAIIKPGITAIMGDNKGGNYALRSDGSKTDVKDTPYYKDPQGWKHAGLGPDKTA